MIPGVLTWTTLILCVALSWGAPVFVSLFIIVFDIYWFCKSMYFLFHLSSTYRAIRDNLAVDWIKKLEEEHASKWRDIYHLVIFPMYKEPYELVRESFESLSRVKYPSEKMIVVLALEERAGEAAQELGARIAQEFAAPFFKFLITTHPADLPGEIPGKGSNETWAAERVKEEILDPLKIPYEKVMTSVFDIDTQTPPHYFSRLTHLFLSTHDPIRAIYQPVPLFVNNIYDAPAIARERSFFCTFWSMIQQSRREMMRSFSSQSIPFATLVDVGFWQKDVVAEDSRIFAQCFVHYNGNFRVEPMNYPVHMDANVGPTFWATLKNQYRQQRRWAWGAEDVSYLLASFWKNKKIPARKRWFWGVFVTEEYYSWATSSIMIFMLGWLPILIGGAAFNHTLLSYNLPKFVQFIMGFSMVGMVAYATATILLLPIFPPRSKYLYFILQWLLTPFALIFFGSIPAIDAQTRLMLGGKWRLGFWVTPKSRRKEIISSATNSR